jgi:hypothetical protein
MRRQSKKHVPENSNMRWQIGSGIKFLVVIINLSGSDKVKEEKN